MVGWLFGIYGISTFNAKSILIQSVLFQQFSLALLYSLIVKTFLFHAIQFIQTILIQTI